MGILDNIPFIGKRRSSSLSSSPPGLGSAPGPSSDPLASLGTGQGDDPFAAQNPYGSAPQQSPYPGQQPPSYPGMQEQPQHDPVQALSSMGTPNQDFEQQFRRPQQQATASAQMTDKNLEVISAKIDAMRASLESINQRLANLEAIARQEQPPQNRNSFY